MAYIHVKKVGSKRYYTLRISVRNKYGKVITKDLENLGSDITKITFENLEKKHKKEIRKSYKTIKQFLDSNTFLEKAKKKKTKTYNHLTKEQIEDLEAIRLHHKTTFSKLDANSKKDIFDMFLIKFAVSSTSIEGNTISLSEATKLLKEDILPKGKSLREVYDLQNTKKVFFDLLGSKKKISLKMIEEVHDALLDRIDQRKGYRTQDINIFGQPFKPTPGRYVKEDIKLLLNWLEKNKDNLHPFILATTFHHKFENIHPFSDGNGRTGRVLLNQILLNANYPPMIVLKTHRETYLNSMNKADDAIKKNLLDINEKYKALIEFLFKEYYDSYWNTFLV